MATDSDHNKYITYRNQFNKLKQCIKESYYITRANKFSNDSRKLRTLLNEVIGQVKGRGSITGADPGGGPGGLGPP